MHSNGKDIFIAMIDAGLDESAVMAFIDGDLGHDKALAVVEALGRDAELAEIIWAMRADRQALIGSGVATPPAEPDASIIARALDSAFPAELDTVALSTIEQTGFTEKPIVDPIYRPARPRRSLHRKRRPRPAMWWATRWAIPLTAAATVAIGALALWKLPIGASHPIAGPGTSSTLAGSETPTGTDPKPTAPVELAASPADQTPMAGNAPVERSPQAGPHTVETPAEALKLARQGRLVVRLASADPTTTRTLVDDLTMTATLSRFASIDGPITGDQSLAVMDALPAVDGPIMASAKHPGPDGAKVAREPVGVYMLRVEPTERAFMLLLTKLRTYDHTIVEIVAAADPVTTPGSASDLSRLRRSPGQWAPKISMPVVVEEIK